MAKVRKLSLLREVAGKVWIPPFVYRELYGKLDEDRKAIEQALSDFIEVHEPEPVAEGMEPYLMGLDAGEREVLELALAVGGDVVVLVDDHAAREVARSLALRLTGTIGLLCTAKEKGLFSGVVDLLAQMRRNGYWLSDEAIEVARQLSGE